MHMVFIPYKSIFLSELVLTCVQFFVDPWTAACQASLPMGFSSQEYWSGLPFPTSEYLPNPDIESESLESPALTRDSLPLVPPEKSSMFLGHFLGQLVQYVPRPVG